MSTVTPIPPPTQVTVFEIPLIPVPQQLQISLAGVNYMLSVSWCWPIQCWIMDIAAADTGVAILQGIPLVTGADLLAQYRYLGIPAQMIVQTDHDTLAQPTFDNLGQLSHLFYVPFQDVPA
jgi:hypothetical protein